MAFLTTQTLPPEWHDPVLTPAQAAAYLALPHHYLILTEAPFAAGHLLLQASPHAAADILTLFVKTEHRSQKFATTLVAHALHLARGNGCTGLTLEVESTNIPAIKAYQNNGFSVIGQRKNYYHNPVSNTKADALVMAVSLA